ncbi:response regulator with CheY-like receiver, AAA-type ATPase, and DNA-binding domains [Sphaerochaeta pleomorpha str. Grapes]|uniref:Response regulator with CheY-like receiver, AAA-type ATPase, and DNA-binding domains n=1 Tax=Sphaerochaeta pleomorpha (strain ATCC BAA-1885 / DSM 22778 / Grapes) TaxID=158190 RepID=G8QQY4_SPHPG|nr:sigma 54-interacting transcriptional regulator [Sphaerochaeta pleomorpha]AEV29832.1 response regulator with CheY-like receiver, AAA-type ATPase, and DNA-binding domains [Sphaerochaeta pleomorpha str. Grapes]
MESGHNGYNQQPLGESEVFLDFQNQLSRAATVNRSVLLVGERGSGKEIAARRLHFLSPRWQQNLVTVNCAALPPSLIETELFGYEQGAFTGAQKTRKGRFEEAEGGTLFLDEIGIIPLEVQEKILRVVEYGTYERVGSSVTHETNVRIIGATNADLPQLCKEGKFKEDLLDRLSFEVLFLPPLRKRGDDILLLANYFAAKMALECGRQEMPILSEEVSAVLLGYSWPGNVRELKNVIERAVYRSDGQVIEQLTLDPFENPYTMEKAAVAENQEMPKKPFDLSQYETARQELDLLYLREALARAKGNQKEAAKLLSLTYDQLRGLYRKFQDRL